MSTVSSPSIDNTSQDRRALLAKALREAASAPAFRPLSFGQQRLWFLDQLEPNSPLYNMATVVRIRGSLDRESLQRALSAVVERHEILRSRFPARDGEPVQLSDCDGPIKIECVDLSDRPEAEREPEAQKLICAETRRPFRLAESFPLRALLIAKATNEHLLLICMHHIVSDEWSLKVFYNELFNFYRSFRDRRSPELKGLSLQYADYAAWQRKWLDGEVLENLLHYWKEQLAGSPPITELAPDCSRQASPSFRGATLSRLLPPGLLCRLQELAGKEQVTLFMLLLAGFKVLVHRYTQLEDIVIGTPIAGRNRPEAEGLIGFFVNTLPLRTRVSDDPPFDRFLRSVREVTLAAFSNQDLPFDKIVEALHPERSLSHMPFTRLMFVMQNSTPPAVPEGLECEFLEVDSGMAKFDITLSAQESKDGLRLRCEYCCDLFQAGTIERLLEHLEVLLTGIAADPRTRLSELALLSPAEERLILHEWNATSTDYPRTKCVHQLFEEQVERTREAVAVSYPQQSLTYGELNSRANQLAWKLRAAGVTDGVPVAVCMRRSVDMVVALLGVVKAGGAYVPLDPSYPQDRLEFMLSDTAAGVLLTQQSLLSTVPCNGHEVICLDADWELIAREARENPTSVTTPESLAYIMYTSGSTGRPKGVGVPHRAIVRLVRNTNYIKFCADDRVAQVANISFDAATFEIWGALLNGGQLVGITRDVALSPADFANDLRERGVTAMFLTSALFSQAANEIPDAFSGLHTLIAGGEALEPKAVSTILRTAPPRRLVNGYGPTENTTFTACHLITEISDSATNVPIGRPISNTRIYILDRHLKPVPIGVPGELYTGGDGLAQGYWKRPELNAERFVPDPFGAPGERLYRTGDLARYLPDGAIEFLGRIDGQVKIRGFRIELGEIETVLNKHPGVRECALTVDGAGASNRRLLAYIVPKHTNAPNASELREFISARLPDYMVPSSFIVLDGLPLTANGKVDRRNLPAPDLARPQLEKRYVPPRDRVEKHLVEIWERVLGVHPVGVDDKFFDLGGHSLLAVKVIAEIEKNFGKKLRLATIFQTPSVSQLAAIIRDERREPTTASSSLVEIHSHGRGAPLFLVHGAGGGMFWGYVNLAKRLERPVYGFKSRGLDGLPEFETIEEMAAQYISDMRKLQPRGPYYLGGYCFGGNVAFEMARQIEAAGEKVGSLILMNCAPPNSRYTQIPWTPAWFLRLTKNLVYWTGYFRSWNRSQRREFFRWKADVFKRKLRCSAPPEAGADLSRVDVRNLVDLSSYSPEQQKVWEAHIRALLRYHPKLYKGRVQLYRSSGHPLWCSFDEDYGWGEFARGGVDITIVAGAHEKILEEPCVESLASHLQLKPGGGTEAQPERQWSSHAILRGFVLRASMFWLGTEGLAWESVGPQFGEEGFSLGVLIKHLALLGIGGAKELEPTRVAVPAEPEGAGPARNESQLTIVSALIPAETAERLERLCAPVQVPVELAYVAALKAFFFRHASQASLLPGTPWKGDAAALNLRCSVNALLLDTEITGDISFSGILEKLRAKASEIGLLGKLATANLKHITLLEVSFERSAGANDFTAPSDFGLRVVQEQQGITLRLTHSSRIVDEGQGRRFLDQFTAFLGTVSNGPGRPITQFPLISPKERELVLGQWNATTHPIQIDRSYAHHFEEAAAKWPDRIAASFRSAEITYRELNSRANQLAQYLRTLGVGPEVIVGVCLDRSLELIVTLLGIWKVGGAYLPLDPSYPEARLSFMLKDSEADVLITQSSNRDSLVAGERTVLCLDDPEVRSRISAQSQAKPELPPDGNSLAYLIYTSGSTGTPKGVEITHRSLVNHNFAVGRIFNLEPADRILQFSPISFDISVEEIFPALLQGARVVFRPDEILGSAERFLKFVERERITILDLPTAYWHDLVDVLQKKPLPTCVRLVAIGGEKASESAFKRWKRCVPASVRLINTYGPTEATVIATTFEACERDQNLPIGRPVANVRVLVLDPQLQPVPLGATGELYIAGEGLARGYFKQPELTRACFIPNPFLQEVPGARLYRTGDLVAWREDGNLEYIGRADQQVKFRGYRVELGEIENALRAHPAVKEAAVLVVPQAKGEQRLVGYLVPRGGATLVHKEIRRFLLDRLPDYMVPNVFVNLQAFPLTPAGKLNKRHLPEPDNIRPELDEAFVAPRTPVEQVLARIWCEVLNLDTVGVLDNFFDLGGHSLTAAKVMARVREALKLEIELATLFEMPTIAALADWLVGTGHPILPWSELSGVRKVELSETQKRIWFLDQFDPRQSPYNFSVAFRLRGALDLSALERSLALLVRRHQALRSVFPVEDGQPVRYVCDLESIPLAIRDLTAVPIAEREAQLDQAAAYEVSRPHFTSSPMFRPVLLKSTEQEHILLLVLHRIGADPDSGLIIANELRAAYGAYATGVEPRLPNLPVDSGCGESASGVNDGNEAHLEYWSKALAGAPEVLDLPADRPRRLHRSDGGDRVALALRENLAGNLSKVAETWNVETGVLLLAGYEALLHRYTSSTDFVIGSVKTSRAHDLANVVGQFAQNVPIRCYVSGDLTFAELVKRVDRTLKEALEHAETAFSSILDRLQIPRNTSHTPLFQVYFQFSQQAIETARIAGLTFEPLQVNGRTARMDLALHLASCSGTIAGFFEYSTDIFDRERVAAMAEHYSVLVEAALANPNRLISELPLMPEAEKQRVLVEWNNARISVPDKTLWALFVEQVQRTPAAEALVTGSTRLTYRELYARAACVGRKLRSAGVGQGTLVGLCLERSWEMVAAILGTLQAGAAYVPMDPAYPQNRLAHILQDAQVRLLISQRKLARRLPAADCTTLCVEDISWTGTHELSESGAPTPDSLAYVIYTSGSTGLPKGVALEHRNAVAFVSWAGTVFSSEELAGVLASTSICFDLSIFELFVPLLNGGKVILAENAIRLPELPAASEVTLVNTVPSAMRELLRIGAVPSSVKVVNLAGEPLATALVDEIYSKTTVHKVYDLYGPTETTTYSTYTLRERGKPATIGKPLANEQVYLLDPNQQPVPIGVPGELYIGGAGVARGYLNRPDLTKERFIVSPFWAGARLYRTGDLARWRRDGNLEYLGRIDHQVKIRGFRIELGEIESVLKKQCGATEAVVIAAEDHNGEKRLVAYVVPKDATTTTDSMRSALKTRLPEFMVPAMFVALKALPLTPNGKIDRKALPSVTAQTLVGDSANLPPRNAMEERVLCLFQEVLGVQDIGVNANFFELGGHSLMAIRLISRVRDAFQVELPLFALFDAPTVEALAMMLAGERTNLQQITSSTPLKGVERTGLLPASFVQERLWFLDQLNPGSDAYNVPAALRLKGKLDIAALQSAYAVVLKRHEALRTVLRFEQDRLVQVILDPVALPIPLTIIEQASEDRTTAIDRFLKAAATVPFDLAQGPLIRLSLLRIEELEHMLVVVMHHTISDGWSLAVFFQELEACYNAISNGNGVPELPELPVQYADFAIWQRESMQGPGQEQELAFWRRVLAGAPAAIDLPADPDVARVAGTAAGRELLRLPSGSRNAVFSFCHQEGLTPFMLLLGALGLSLTKWTGQRDLVTGTVVAGRSRRELESAIGCFMNFLPLRLKPDMAKTSRQFLSDVRRVLLEAQTHQDCPFQRVVEAINPERRQDQNPLYNVALLMQNFPSELFRGNGLKAEMVPLFVNAPLLDLRFEAEDKGEELLIHCEYKSDLFKPQTIAALLESYRQAIQALVAKPDCVLAEFATVPELEQQSRRARERARKYAVRVAANFTAEPIEEPLRYWMKELEIPVEVEFAPYNQVFQQLLDSGSLLNTNETGFNLILIRLEDWNKSKAEHGDHSAASNAELERLLEERSLEFINALSSAASRTKIAWIVLLCPPSPQIKAEAGMKDVLAKMEGRLADSLEKISSVHTISSRNLIEDYAMEDYADPAADQLGHVPYTPAFFTALATVTARRFHLLKRSAYKVIALDCDNTLWSGVCGEDGPKGIHIDAGRRALQEFMRAQHSAGMLVCLCSKNNPEDVEDVFAQRLDMPLRREHISALRLNWLPKSQNLQALAKELNLGLDSFIFIDDNPVECAEVEANCPEVLTLLLPESVGDIPGFLKHCWAFDHLKLTAEDRLRAESYRQNKAREALRAQAPSLADFLAGLELEIAIKEIDPADLPRAAQLTQRTNQFNFTTRRRTEAEMEQVRSCSHVLTVHVKDRFGDYGLVGVIIFDSRSSTLEIDTFLLSCRVLGRGVEHRMLAHVGELARKRGAQWVDVHFTRSAKNKPAYDFLENVGAPFKQAQNGGFLFRFPAGYATEVAFNGSSTELKSQVESAPAALAALNSGAFGKFSKCREVALQCMDMHALHRRIERAGLGAAPVRRQSDNTGPRTDLERKLCRMWEALLKVPVVGIHDDFFELGGHSLLAVRLFAEVEKLTGRKLPLVTLFQAPTIEALAGMLADHKSDGPHRLLVPIQPRGTKPPLFLVHGAGGDVLWGYANLATHLGDDQPIYGVKSRGQAGLEEFNNLEAMARSYVEELRSFQPHGPYYLGGYCFGGNVAYEMARQLEASGEPVALVALLDSAPSNAGYETVRWWQPAFAFRFARNFGLWAADFYGLEGREQRAFFARKGRALVRKLKSFVTRKAPAQRVDLEDIIDTTHFPENELRLWQVHLEALVKHRDRGYSGPVLLLRTRGQPLFCSLQPDFCWGRLASALTVKLIPGSHEQIFMEPHVNALAKELERSLASARERLQSKSIPHSETAII